MNKQTLNSTFVLRCSTLAILALLLGFAFPSVSKGQGGVLLNGIVVLGSTGRPVAGAQVTVCQFSDNGVPCTQTVNLFSDPGLTTAKANPGTTDGNGNFIAYAAPGVYHYTVTNNGVSTTGQPFTVVASGNGNKNTFVVDGSQYPTVQAAMTAANTATGGVVLIPDGTYVGPTTFYSGVTLQAMHPSRPNVCLDATPINCINATATTSNVTLTYTSNLTLSDLTKVNIIGLTMDFGGLGGLIVSGVNTSYFDFTVRHAASTGPCSTFRPSSTNNIAFLDVPYFACSGGSEGMLFTKNATSNFVTDSHFGYVFLAGIGGSPATYTAVDFASNCDSNSFDFIQVFAGQATVFGVIFNSASAVADTDANSNLIKYIAFTGSFSSGGMGLTFNPSSGNIITTGSLPWGALNIVSIAAGGPVNSPSFTWMQSSPTAGAQAAVVGNIIAAQSGNASSSPAFQMYKGTAFKWQMFDDGSDNFKWSNAASSTLLGLDQSGNLTIFGGGSLLPGSTTFAGLGTPSNGRVVYCPDCTLANPCAGGGTGALAKRLNGVWVCN